MTTTSTLPASTPAEDHAPDSRPGAGFHLPSYLLGLTTALILLGAALFFWPRPQPAALQLQAPPAVAPTAAAPAAAVATQAPTPSPLVVFVSGAVAQPGLYTLAPTARIGDALAAAGGLLPGVDGALINQAQLLVDGAQLHIPAPTAAPTAAPLAMPGAAEAQAAETPVAETPVAETPVAAAANAAAAPPPVAPTLAPPITAPAAQPAGQPVAQPPAGLSVAQPLPLPTPTAAAVAPVAAPADRAVTVELPAAGSLINVNTATGAELESLPGIGPAKAQAIIDNRPFATVEELDRVPGIGPATLEQIRPLVTTE